MTTRADFSLLTQREMEGRARLAEAVKARNASLFARYARGSLWIAGAVSLVALALGWAWRLAHPVEPATIPPAPAPITNNYYSKPGDAEQRAQDLASIHDALPQASEGNGERVHDEYTVFRSVEVDESSLVVTGYNYLAPNFSTPSNQYCYYREASQSTPNESIRHEIGSLDPEQSELVVWHDGAIAEMRNHCRFLTNPSVM